MNVEQLRRALAELPGDVPVVLDDCQMGWMANAGLYLAPAHLDCGITGNHLHARHRDGADNCHALLISGLGQVDPGVVDISPQIAWPEVIDVEVDVRLPGPQLPSSIT
ncbi:hypothetical protein GCM10009641_02150 [Mycobacterium cookii]|uniref:Uncharacterized protein n=1 Tax=Mycobacterium cookii TaxID=1775 RepID=A0A7I7L422_9MYCO|nr:hypothetical protein [Mycobacterium cookii]MCV7329429.1 hypothetical protein [Mycobacterium cookii]BBX48739.1 hypothetical protein MCOO_47540 [Mycobacterium cookii]